jgi:protein-disulfide isomerase
MEQNTLTKREKRQLAKEEKRKESRKANVVRQIRNWSIGLLIVGVLVFGGYRVWKWASSPVETVDVQEVLGVAEDDWVKGNPEAQITIVEYSDFQCFGCASFQPLVKRVAEEYSDDVKIVYRHFPLVAIHSNAFNAAKASEAAGNQDKFWEMHDMLFAKQEEWSDDRNAKNKFVGYAESLELDIEKFKSDFESDEVKERVEKDLFDGQRLGVSATPTFYMNGEKLNGIKGFDDFASRINELTNN